MYQIKGGNDFSMLNEGTRLAGWDKFLFAPFWKDEPGGVWPLNTLKLLECSSEGIVKGTSHLKTPNSAVLLSQQLLVQINLL